MTGMRSCDNCGAWSDGPRCSSCGKPFPPPAVSAPHEEQVEFAPAAEAQRPVVRLRPPGQRVHLPPPGQPSGHAHEAYGPYMAADLSYVRGPRRATGALVVAVLSIALSLTGGFLGLVTGFLAMYLGKKAKDQGLEGAGTATSLGLLGILLTIIFAVLWATVL